MLWQQLTKVIRIGKYEWKTRANVTKLIPDTSETYKAIVKCMSDSQEYFKTYKLRTNYPESRDQSYTSL